MQRAVLFVLLIWAPSLSRSTLDVAHSIPARVQVNAMRHMIDVATPEDDQPIPKLAALGAKGTEQFQLSHWNEGQRTRCIVSLRSTTTHEQNKT